MYTYNTKIRLFHTDAAGVMFHSKLFDIAHECYEEFLEKSGLSIKKIFDDRKFLSPVVHAQADYFKSLIVGDKITIRMSLDSLGKSSFAFNYILYNELDEKAAELKIIHALIDPKSGKSIKIPKNLFKILDSLKT